VLTGIDHVVIAVPDPDAAADELGRAVGLRATGGGRHESMGTFNRLAWLGDTYVELIGVWDAELAATSWVGRPTLTAVERGGGLATFALASDAIDDDLARFRSLGARWEGPIKGERSRPDGRTVRWANAMPGELAPDGPPFVIEHDVTAAEWTPGERANRGKEVHPIGGHVRLEVLELAVPDVRHVVDRYRRAFGLAFRPSLAGGGARDLSVGDQIVRLRRGPDAASTVRLLADGGTARDVEAVGLRWVVRA
jgi:hypothetical protein